MGCIEPAVIIKVYTMCLTLTNLTLTLGFLHSRTNLSPFTKDFRGEDQFDEYDPIFLRSCLRDRHYVKKKTKTDLINGANTFWYYRRSSPLVTMSSHARQTDKSACAKTTIKVVLICKRT